MTNTYFRIYAILFLSLVLLASFVVNLGPTEAKTLMSETGPIERASALGYFLCAGYMLSLIHI